MTCEKFASKGASNFTCAPGATSGKQKTTMTLNVNNTSHVLHVPRPKTIITALPPDSFYARPHVHTAHEEKLEDHDIS